MMSQNFLNYLNLLHAQRLTLENAGKSGLIQNSEWPLILKGEQGLEKDWEVETTAN